MSEKFKSWKKIHRKKQLENGFFDGRFIEKREKPFHEKEENKFRKHKKNNLKNK